MRTLLTLSLLLIAPSLALAATVTVRDAWSPPSLSQENGVGFMVLRADKDDVLLRVSGDCCTAIELHTHSMDGDVMRMRRVEHIALPAGRDVALQPGGYHLMLIGLKKPLVDGKKLPVTLHFNHAPTQNIMISISSQRQRESIRARDGAHTHH